MKKTLLSAAAFAVVAVSAVSIAPTTSEAIPAFARQTGAACLSCHFQTFPALNGFGRAFKLGAFTDVGEQALIEDDNFSLPAVLNLGMVLRPAYVRTKDKNALANVSKTTSQWSVPTDSNLLVAGRVGSNTGAFVEFNAGAGNFQLMNSFDFDTFQGGLNIAGTSFGPTAALELGSVYGQHGGKLFGSDVSAVENIMLTGGDTSIALWASNGTFTVQAAAVVVGTNVANNALDGTGVINNSFVPMIAATYTGDIGSFAAVVEVGTMTGTQSAATGAVAANGGLNAVAATAAGVGSGVKATWLAAQLQGEVGDASLGIYGDFVTTKSDGAAKGNLYATALNNGTLTDAKVDGYSIRAEIEPIHQLMFGIGFGSVKVSPVTGTAVTTTRVHYAATYEIYQNMEVTLSQTNVKNGLVSTNANAVNTESTRIEIEAVF